MKVYRCIKLVFWIRVEFDEGSGVIECDPETRMKKEITKNSQNEVNECI